MLASGPWPSQAPYPKHPFSQLFEQTAQRLPDKPAFIIAVKAEVEPADASAAGPELEAELPRHPTGKLDKRLLKARYWGGRG